MHKVLIFVNLIILYSCGFNEKKNKVEDAFKYQIKVSEESKVIFGENASLDGENNKATINIRFEHILAVPNANKINLIIDTTIAEGKLLKGQSITESYYDNNKNVITETINKDSSSNIWEYQTDSKFTFIDQNIISFKITKYTFSGGAHANETIVLHNINPKNGSIYNLNDLIKEKKKEAFEAIVKAELIKQKEKLYKDDPEIVKDFESNFVLPRNFGFTRKGFLLYYNPYEMDSFAAGPSEIIIPYKKFKKFTKVEL